MDKTLKILIIDDHTLFRKGLKEILLDFTKNIVCKEAKSGQEALKMLAEESFNLIFLDIAMPEEDGIEILRKIKKNYPETKVLMLSMYPEEQYAKITLKLGASGYLTKSAEPEELYTAIDRVIKGHIYLPKIFSERLIEYIGKPEKILPHETLSDREFQVFIMIARGKSLIEISRELSISIKTVSTYRARILEKLDLKNNAEIICYAIKHGLIT